jgi:multiple sugar transport system substrate-binding protein
VPFPQIYPAKNAVWGDGHTIVMPKSEATDEQRQAACEFLRFVWDNNFEWARTGHVPASQKVFDSAEFKALPHRDKLAALAEIATPRPAEVKRQFAVQDIEGEEVGAAMTGQKPIDQALADAESRINELLANAE